MRKKDSKYSAWLKRYQIRKGKRNTVRKSRKFAGEFSTTSNQTVKKQKGKGKKNEYKVQAPSNFSIIENAQEVIPFFDDILKFTNRTKDRTKIFFDMSNVINISADAIIYLIAIIKDLQSLGQGRHNFAGNLPTEKRCAEYIRQSGFFKYMESTAAVVPTTESKQIRIISKSTYDQEDTTKKICDFVCSIANCDKTKTKYLFVLLGEMMLNTVQHAYNDNKRLNNWYVSAQSVGDKILFTFLDTGLGIPKTVRTRFTEKIFPNESAIVESALKGVFRTRTKKGYRGKGLPKMAECVKNNSLEKLFVISSRAYCELKYSNSKMIIDKKEQSRPIAGTVYYWEMDIKKEIKYD